MIPIQVEDLWCERFPGARIGVLEATGLEPIDTHPELETLRQALEEELRHRLGSLDRRALRELPTLQVFESYFRRHGKTYHVLQQLESIAVKGRAIPSRICAVTAMFMAELQHGLVTAGHDLEPLCTPLSLTASRGDERYTNLTGKLCAVPEGDMIICNSHRVLSSVLHGPERDSPITIRSRSAVFTVYAPAGVATNALKHQLHDLETYLRVFSPGARVETRIMPTT
jgi:DNA/RNA-binding domain of Phe-tRNA-synthetase-like protein